MFRVVRHIVRAHLDKVAPCVKNYALGIHKAHNTAETGITGGSVRLWFNLSAMKHSVLQQGATLASHVHIYATSPPAQCMKQPIPQQHSPLLLSNLYE